MLTFSAATSTNYYFLHHMQYSRFSLLSSKKESRSKIIFANLNVRCKVLYRTGPEILLSETHILINFQSAILDRTFRLVLHLIFLLFMIWFSWLIHIFREMWFDVLVCCWLSTFVVTGFPIKICSSNEMAVRKLQRMAEKHRWASNIAIVISSSKNILEREELHTSIA